MATTISLGETVHYLAKLERTGAMNRTIIVSDIHLGARNNQSAELTRLLAEDYDCVVLNGDTIDHLNLKRFSATDWALLHQLRQIARRRELILIRGNHEGRHAARTLTFGPLDVLADLIGTVLREEYMFWVGRRRYLVLHGDQFDQTLNMTRLGKAADHCYSWIQRWSRPLACWLKGRVKRWGGVIRCVRNGAVRYALNQGVHGVIAGHTHFHEETYVDAVHYLNTGCWVDSPCTYLLAEGDQLRLCAWTPDLPCQRVVARPMDTARSKLTAALAG
jgi:UDP-2,3-diacylglucosamine pyrophosphatase LpxH